MSHRICCEEHISKIRVKMFVDLQAVGHQAKSEIKRKGINCRKMGNIYKKNALLKMILYDII